jgi:hypothetical protein
MGLIDEALKSDADLAFVDTDTFGESITYTPLNGSVRTISAVVDRNPPILDANQATLHITVLVRNHATAGITAAEAKVGGTIRLSRHVGQTAESFASISIEQEDAGMLFLRLR